MTNSELDKLDDKLVVGAKWIVAELDRRNVSVYVTLAKAALWSVGFLLTFIMLRSLYSAYGVWTATGMYPDAQLNVVVQSSQVLVLLAVSVLGFHKYEGSRVLHILRNLKG